MIVRELDGEWLLVDQAEHARHAGRLAEAWAEGPLAHSALEPGLLTAVRLHDIGWTRPDAQPELDPETGGPLHFTKVLDDRHAGFYTEGIGRVIEVDPYAGYLVSLHATGIYSGRFGWNGLQPVAWASIGERGRRLLDEQAAYRRSLAPRIGDAESVLDFERVWRDYALLQTFDYLSLFLCAGLESSGCGPVPEGRHGWQNLRVSRVAMLGAVIEPFPFARDRLEIDVECRRLARRRFESTSDLRQAIATTPRAACTTWFQRA